MDTTTVPRPFKVRSKAKTEGPPKGKGKAAVVLHAKLQPRHAAESSLNSISGCPLKERFIFLHAWQREAV